MKEIIEKLYNSAQIHLKIYCPIMSGNMYEHIKDGDIGENEKTIVIEAPIYDVNIWEKTGKRVLTYKSIFGYFTSDYAVAVNEVGAFGTHNKSEHWANRALKQACDIIASEIGAEVICELPLD